MCVHARSVFSDGDANTVVSAGGSSLQLVSPWWGHCLAGSWGFGGGEVWAEHGEPTTTCPREHVAFSVSGASFPRGIKLGSGSGAGPSGEGPLAQASLPGCETQALNGLLGALCLSAPVPPGPSRGSRLPRTPPPTHPSASSLSRTPLPGWAGRRRVGGLLQTGPDSVLLLPRSTLHSL